MVLFLLLCFPYIPIYNFPTPFALEEEKCIVVVCLQTENAHTGFLSRMGAAVAWRLKKQDYVEKEKKNWLVSQDELGKCGGKKV